jgi:hypothetical protein
VEGGPVINIHYLDIAFISTGEGVGYNVLRGDHYQLGIALTSIFTRNYKRRNWTWKEQIAAVSALSNESSPHCTPPGSGYSPLPGTSSAHATAS